MSKRLNYALAYCVLGPLIGLCGLARPFWCPAWLRRAQVAALERAWSARSVAERQVERYGSRP